MAEDHGGLVSGHHFVETRALGTPPELEGAFFADAALQVALHTLREHPRRLLHDEALCSLVLGNHHDSVRTGKQDLSHPPWGEGIVAALTAYHKPQAASQVRELFLALQDTRATTISASHLQYA